MDDPFGLAGSLLEGQYRVDAVVGEGGFGVVYRGKHLSLEQPIAIKVLKGLDGGDPAINHLILEKFRSEARLLYTLSQSSLHIVRSLDFGATTTPSGVWAPFMILEWLDGRSLADDLNERRQRGMRGRSIDEAFAILELVADGLAVAHHRQVAHRDVKPANIFLLGGVPGQHGPQVKVLDFGIAKIMKDGEAAGTKGTFASFTWLYAAPEQLDPRVGRTGLETDVYGFGLLVTELMTDRAPIDDRDVVGIMKTATNPNRRPTPRARGASIPDAIEEVCQRALAVDPRNRFANVSELWKALVAARAERPSTTMHAAAPASVVFTPRAPSPSSPGSTVMTPQSSANLGPTGVVPASVIMHGSMQAQLLQGSATAPRGHVLTPIPPMMTGAPMTGPPLGTRPPGLGASPPRPMNGPSPPAGTHPPFAGPPMAPFTASPPRGTLPPGQYQARFVRADGTSPVVVVTIIFFVLALLLAGSCALVHGACNAATS